MNVPMSNETDTSQPREDLFLKNTMTQHTEEGLNLNFQTHLYGVAFLNPWNIPNKI